MSTPDVQTVVDEALAELKQTTVGYLEYARLLTEGKYTPKDGSGTHWQKAEALLSPLGSDTPNNPTVPTVPAGKGLSIWVDDGMIESTFQEKGAWQYAVAQQPAASGDAIWSVANAGCPVFIYGNIEDIDGPDESDPAGLNNGVSYNDAVTNNWFVAGWSGSAIVGGGPTYNEGGAPFSDGTYVSYLADVSNSGYIAKWISNMIALCHANGFAGVHIDNTIQNGAHVITSGAAPVPQSNWAAYQITALTSIVSAFHAASPPLKVGCNINAYGSAGWDSLGSTDRAWLAQVVATGIDVAFREYFLFYGNGARASDSGSIALWLDALTDTQTAGCAFVARPGYGVIEGDPDTMPNVQRERYARAAFLTYWDGYGSSYSSLDGDASWNQNFGYFIGTPAAAAVAVGGGYSRAYHGPPGALAGLALWNPSGSPQAFTLTGTWENQAGTTGLTGTVTVPAYDGWALNRTA